MAKHAWFTLIVVLSLVIVATSQDCVNSVYLKTGTKDAAGTDANVRLVIYDDSGYKVEIYELSQYGLMGSGYDYYENGHLDYFAAKGDCLLSKPCKIELTHDNSGDYPGWYVDHLEVSTAGPQHQCFQQRFNIDQWLALDEPPYQLSLTRDLCSSSSSSSANTTTALPRPRHDHHDDKVIRLPEPETQ